MKDQRKTEIKVGIMVILGLIIFLWILGWAKNFTFRDTDRTLNIRFSNVSGLEIGDYVTVNGVRKGVVEEYIIRNNNVIVKIGLDRDVVLKKDAAFAVTMLDLMGGKKIDINPGNSPEELNYDEIQTGTYYADIPAVMSMLGNVQDDLFATLKEVNITLTSLNKYFTDEKIDNEVRTSISSIRDISLKLNSMIDENRLGLKELLENTVVLTKDAKEIISANREDIESSIKSLQSILTQTDTLVQNLNRISEETIARENNLGKILYDEGMMEDITGMLNETRQLIKILTDQLQNQGIKVDASIDLF